jgi:hypothetical protein
MERPVSDDPSEPAPPVISLLFGQPDPDAPVLVLVTSLCAPLQSDANTRAHRDATLGRRAHHLRKQAAEDGREAAFDDALALLVETLAEPIFDPGGPVAIAVRGGARPVVWEVALPEPPSRQSLTMHDAPPHWLAHEAEASGRSAHDHPDSPTARTANSATAVRVPSGRHYRARVRSTPGSDGAAGVRLVEQSRPRAVVWRSPGYPAK